MKFLLVLLSLFFFKINFACNCQVKPELDIKDWNDTEAIFTGELINIEKTATIKKLTFLVKNKYKGDFKKQKINFNIPTKNHSQIFDYENEMFLGQQWILFAKTYNYNDDQKFKLLETSDRFCMRSRPFILNGSDPYINFINELNHRSNLKNQTYFNKHNTPIATGSIKNKLAEGYWKYYLSTSMKNNYWEGYYKKGKRVKNWYRKAINFKNDLVVIEQIIYDDGLKKEHIKYNYINEKKSHIIYENDKRFKFKYSNNQLILKMTYYKKNNSTIIEYFKNGKITSSKTKQGRFF